MNSLDSHRLLPGVVGLLISALLLWLAAAPAFAQANAQGEVRGIGMTARAVMSELFGRVDGYCRGLGGSMHIADVDTGNLATRGDTVVGVVGVVAFTWPFFVNGDFARDHGNDAPWLFAVLLGTEGEGLTSAALARCTGSPASRNTVSMMAENKRMVILPSYIL